MTTPQYVIGIDPGLSGAMAVVKIASGELMKVLRMPTRKSKTGKKELHAQELNTWLFAADRTLVAFIEDVHGRPRQKGVFDFGFNTGMVHGLLIGNGIEVEKVTPQKWKFAYGIRRATDEAKAEKKSQAREIATQLFPSHADEFKRDKDDGVAEAALIALYGAQIIQTRSEK